MTPVVVSDTTSPRSDRAGGLQRTDDCDVHSVDSSPVSPTRLDKLPSTSPSAIPTTVTDVAPVDATLLETTLLIKTLSYENMSSLPRQSRDAIELVRTTTPLSEIHCVACVCVTGSVVVILASARPKLCPTTVTLVEPVAAPFVALVDETAASV